jgi:hypothetical protein
MEILLFLLAAFVIGFAMCFSLLKKTLVALIRALRTLQSAIRLLERLQAEPTVTKQKQDQIPLKVVVVPLQVPCRPSDSLPGLGWRGPERVCSGRWNEPPTISVERIED